MKTHHKFQDFNLSKIRNYNLKTNLVTTFFQQKKFGDKKSPLHLNVRHFLFLKG